MPRSDRLLRLLQAMRIMVPPITAARLAEETGVSVRSLYRDIDALRASGARIDGERGYGYRLVEDFALPPQAFTRVELEALTIGMAEVALLGDPELAAAATSVLAKITAGLPDGHEMHLRHAMSLTRRSGTRYADAPAAKPIRDACWKEQAVIIRYVDKAFRETERTICPLAIVYLHRQAMVLARCLLRDDFRMFAVDRIQFVRLTPENFRPRRVSLLQAYLAHLRRQ